MSPSQGGVQVLLSLSMHSGAGSSPAGVALMLSSTMPAKFAVTVTLHPQVLEGTRCWRGFEGLGQPFVGHSRFWPVLPRAAPSVGVVTCTCEQRFRPLN